jgi:hypothetical protein
MLPDQALRQRVFEAFAAIPFRLSGLSAFARALPPR